MPVDIKTTTDKPIRTRFLKIPYKLKEEVHRQEKEMEECGVLVKSDTDNVSCWVFVGKKDGTKRPCGDFRLLNEITVSDLFPMPRTDTLLEQIAGCNWYSALDLSNGYLQLPLTENASRLCGIITDKGIYQFTRMPFGLKNAPAAFMRVMSEVFKGMDHFVVVYIDDIVIFTRGTFAQHLEHIRQVMERLNQYNPETCTKEMFLRQKRNRISRSHRQSERLYSL